MRRGDIVTAATGSGFGSKPRPALVIQDEDYSNISTILLALISSDEKAGRVSINVAVEPSASNGLRRVSFVMVHELLTVRMEKLDKRIGRLSEADMRRVDRSLMTFLGLDRN